MSLVYPKVKVDVLSDPEGSLCHPAGLLTWTGFAAHWRMRCSFKKKQASPPIPTPDLNQFLHSWSSSLEEWIELPTSSLTVPILKGFVVGNSSFIAGGRFRYSPPQSIQSPTKGPRRSATYKGLKPDWRALLHEAQNKISNLTALGWHVVFSDGSAILEDDLSWVGGYGAYFGDSYDFSEPLPTKEPPTNNRAELRALLRVLQTVATLPSSKR